MACTKINRLLGYMFTCLVYTLPNFSFSFYNFRRWRGGTAFVLFFWLCSWSSTAWFFNSSLSSPAKKSYALLFPGAPGRISARWPGVGTLMALRKFVSYCSCLYKNLNALPMYEFSVHCSISRGIQSWSSPHYSNSCYFPIPPEHGIRTICRNGPMSMKKKKKWIKKQTLWFRANCDPITLGNAWFCFYRFF